MKEKLPVKKEAKTTMKGSRLFGVLLFLILIAIDQLTKLLADVYFNDIAGAPDKIVLIPNMIELLISYNRGIAFSGLSDAEEWVKIAIVAATGVLMTVFAIVYFKMDKRRTLIRIAIVLVVAGGVGNLIDRVYYRVWDPTTAAIIRDGVRDMVRVNIIFDFGVCNFADFFIVGGAVLLLLSLLFFDREAIFPVGKYKVLAKEAEEKAEAKKAEGKPQNG